MSNIYILLLTGCLRKGFFGEKNMFRSFSPTLVHSVYACCNVCPTYNPGKSLCGSQDHFPLPKGPFDVWQLDFVQLPPSQGNKYMFIMVFMFSHWLEAFPCRRAMALTVGELLFSLVQSLSCV